MALLLGEDGWKKTYEVLKIHSCVSRIIRLSFLSKFSLSTILFHKIFEIEIISNAKVQ